MKGKWKAAAILVALGLVASAFTACSGTTPEPAPASSNKAESKTESKSNAASNEVTELTWWHWGDAPKNPDKVIEALNEKSAKDIGVKINFVWATGDDQKLKTALSTGASDDIAFTCSWFASYALSAQKGQLYDITEMVKTDTPDLYNSLPEFAWKAAEVNGKIFAVPTYKDIAATIFWRVNKEYVLDGAQAQEEFAAVGQRNSTLTPLLKKVKEYADAGHPYPHDATAPYSTSKAGVNPRFTGTENIQADAGICIKDGDPEHKVIWEYEDPDNIADLRTINEWYKAGYVNADAPQIDKEPEFITVFTGQGWRGAEKSVWGLNKDYTEEIMLRYGPTANTYTVIGSMQGIFANSKHPKEALQYIEYMNTNAEYRNLLGYGIENVNYKDNGDGTITGINSDWQPGLFSQATFMLLKPAAPAPATMYQDMEADMSNAKASDLMGFVVDIEPIKTEISACSTVLNKYKDEFATGASANFDQSLKNYEKEMKAAGLDKVKEEIQKQVDAFLAK